MTHEERTCCGIIAGNLHGTSSTSSLCAGKLCTLQRRAHTVHSETACVVTKSETKLRNSKQHDARLEACLGFDDGVQVLAEVEASWQVHIQPVHVEPHAGILIQVWTSGMSRFACCRWDCGTTQTDSKSMTTFSVGLSWHRVRYGRRERFDGFDQRLRLHSAHLLHSVSSASR